LATFLKFCKLQVVDNFTIMSGGFIPAKFLAPFIAFTLLSISNQSEAQTAISDRDAGIIELNRHHPIPALVYLRKALRQNPQDSLTLIHLYQALRLSGNYQEARLLTDQYPEEIIRKTGLPAKRLVTDAWVEMSSVSVSSVDSIKQIRPEAQMADLYLITSYTCFSAGIRLTPGARFSLSLSGNLTNCSASQQFLLGTQIPRTYDVPFEQRGVYIFGSYYAGDGFLFSLAGQMITYTLPLYHWERTYPGLKDVLGATDYQDLALNASVTKRFPYGSATLFGDANRLRRQWFQQAGAELEILPFGHTNTYLRAGETWYSDTLKPSGNFTTHILIGQKIFGRWWIEGNFHYGSLKNYSEQNAKYVFDYLPIVKNQIGVSLVSKEWLPHLDLSASYSYSKQTVSWQIFENYTYFEQQEKSYPAHRFSCAINWRF